MKHLEKLRLGNTVYLKDEFNETLIRLTPVEGKTKAFIKSSYGKEYPIELENKTVFDLIIGGIEISKKEYDEFGIN